MIYSASKSTDSRSNVFVFEEGIDSTMKPAIVADEMFPEGAGPYMDLEEAGGSSGLLMDLAANEKAVHADFFNDFEDLYDDEDLN
ncbi:uncharacterized protein LOC100302525 isoform X2 [Tribolium castaneum]|uniref:uncharacterized protein LOC100302525 isoform X2 n=1 Tax=Tribolium castaneum TaxID=7070 RepID=UPI00077DB910|nr:PREDICTED: uncharacterized protein LOC100302525 isoform X2 [Tribolium castaneum]|eukprot:XP_015835192.1 PREDICTED: uncharacterized protein LOC100302525 isoform X2 [Tribolium castaneum]